VEEFMLTCHSFYLVRAKNIKEIYTFEIPEGRGVLHDSEKNY